MIIKTDIAELETEQRVEKHISRRQFVKKAVYATPSVVMLGSVLTPTTALAFGSNVDTTDNPGGGFGGGTAPLGLAPAGLGP